MKGKFSIVDGIGYLIGVVVVGFIIFILIWPIIDPTPGKSATIKENVEQLTLK